MREAYHLFAPEMQIEEFGKTLHEDATKKQVAKNIWAFLKVKGYNKGDFVTQA